MRKTVLILACLFPAALAAQSIITVPPQQCVWRAGDDPTWAASNLDESGWQPYSTWKIESGPSRLWVRCHTDLSSLHSVAQPTIQVTLYSAYQLYLNGTLLGAEGNLGNGNTSLNNIRSWPIPSQQLPAGPATLALRIRDRITIPTTGPIGSLIESPLQIRAGDAPLLDALRAQTILSRESQHTAAAIYFGIVGVIAVILLGLYFYDRSRSEFLLLSVSCLGLTALRLNELAAAALLNYSVSACLAIAVLGNFSLAVAEVPFFYAVARRRMPVFIIVLLVLMMPSFIPTAVDALFAANRPVWVALLYLAYLRPFQIAVHTLLSLAPYLAFWPFTAIPRRMRPLAALCMLWGAADFIWYAVEMTSTPLPGIPNLFARWGLTLLSARGLTIACLLSALFALLFRDQRQITEERAQLAGEMASAREIQQYLIPDQLPPTPGLAIRSVYQPSREVGGDFFQVLPNPRDGSTLIVVGDVAGKGLKAGMLAALIVGAIRTAFQFTPDPGRILALLNERLQGRGLVTCLAMRIDRNGNVELANAGHLPPYINGKELALEGAFPLGALPAFSFPSQHFQLSAGESLLLVSDGVVEARNSAGELFGFERTAAISTESAETIAYAAQSFGQDDDITVLTLTRLAPTPTPFA
jgi:hypothetical protein